MSSINAQSTRPSLAFGPADAARSLGVAVVAWGAGSSVAKATDDPAATTKPATVTVTGVRPLLGDKIPLTLQDTPQSVSVIPRQLIEDQADTRLEQALRNVPGITLNAGEGAARGDTVNLRGFSAFNDFFLDGIRDAAVYDRDTFDLETVEVLKGPSATLFGRGSTGGAINQVSKAPSLEPFVRATLEGGTNSEVRATADVDEPLGASAAFRLNLMGERSNVADRDDVLNRRWGVAPALSLGLGGPTTLTLSYMHLQENNVPDVGVPFVFGAPAPVLRNADFGLASDHANSRVDVGTAVLRHEFSPTLSLTDTLRAASYGFDYVFAAPNFGDPEDGGQGPPAPGTPLSTVLVGRDSPSSRGVQTNLTNQLDLTWRFETGFVRHVLVAGTELARQTNSVERLNNPFDTDNAWVPLTPLLDPDPSVAGPAEPVSARQRTVADSEAAYVSDTMSFGPRLDVIAGARVDRFAARYHQFRVATGTTLDLSPTDVVGSPRLAIVYKPAPWQSFYASYSTSFDPSAEALSLTSGTADLGPVKGTTYEVGSKSSLMDGRLLLTAALFHTEVNNAQTNDPDNPSQTLLNGDERVQGLEVGLTGHLTSRLEIVAGYTYLDGVTSGVGESGPYHHTVVPNLARNAVNVWSEYDLSSRLEVGLGVNYIDRRYADVYNTASVPSSLIWNAMASFKLNPKLVLQVNAFNLTNAVYYTGVYYTDDSENHTIPGAGRTVKFTLKAAF